MRSCKGMMLQMIQLWVLWFIKDSFFINPGLGQKFHWLIHLPLWPQEKLSKTKPMLVTEVINGLPPCDISKNSEKWVKSKYVKSERLGIVPGTWFDEKQHFIASNLSFHDILYTVRFVWMRRIQPCHFHYVIRMGRQSLQENTVFLILHYDRNAGVT